MNENKNLLSMRMRSYVDNDGYTVFYPDPFSARLAGVTRVIEELEKGVK